MTRTGYGSIEDDPLLQAYLEKVDQLQTYLSTVEDQETGSILGFDQNTNRGWGNGYLLATEILKNRHGEEAFRDAVHDYLSEQ